MKWNQQVTKDSTKWKTHCSSQDPSRKPLLPAKAENRNKALTSVLRMSQMFSCQNFLLLLLLLFWLSRDSKTSARTKNCVSHAQNIILINQRGRHLGPDSNWMPIYVHTRSFTNNRERRKQFWPKFWIETITLMLLRTSEGRAILRLSESNCAIVTTDLPRWSLIFSKKGVQVTQWDPK